MEVIRAAELPVNRCLSLPWNEFCQLMHSCWEQSTALANWSVQQLVRNDVMRTPGMEKYDKNMPVCPCVLCSIPIMKGKNKGKPKESGINLYRHWTQSELYPFWGGACVQANDVIQMAEKRYKALRYEIIWKRSAVPPTFKYPTPFPVKNTNWEPRIEHGKPVINVALPGGRVDLELRTGPEFGRQLTIFHSLIRGDFKKCQLILRGQYTTSSNGRQTLKERSPGGGDRRFLRILCKLVVRTESAKRTSDRILTLCTDPEALWVAELDGRQAWKLNVDHLRRAVLWHESHRVRIQRWSEDCKVERRSNPKRLRQFEESRERCCLKHRRRMDSWIKESVSHLVQFCLRQKVGTVAYTGKDTSFLPGFPWSKLNQRLIDAMKIQGIEVVTDVQTNGGN